MNTGTERGTRIPSPFTSISVALPCRPSRTLLYTGSTSSKIEAASARENETAVKRFFTCYTGVNSRSLLTDSITRRAT